MKNKVNRALVAKKKVFLFIAALTLSVGLWAESPTRDVCVVEIYNGDQLLYRAFNPTDVVYLQEKVPIYEYIDLGLPSGTLWATTNVGADSPTGIGTYFMWGDIVGNAERYDWEHYPYGEGDWAITKYCTQNDRGKDGFVDNITVLLPEDDAATQNRGHEWRMPTIEEWLELNNKEYTVQENTTNYKETGVAGIIVYKKKEGEGATYYPAMDTHIFLPAGGYYDENGLNYSTDFVYATPVQYWSSSLSNFSNMAHDKKNGGWGSAQRCLGKLVRAVYVGNGNTNNQ